MSKIIDPVSIETFFVEKQILRNMHPEFKVQEESISSFDSMIEELMKDEDFLRCGIAKVNILQKWI